MSTRLEQQRDKGKSKTTVSAAVLVAVLAVGGWWYSRPAHPPSAAVVTNQWTQGVKEVPGAIQSVDLAAKMQADRQAVVGTEARRLYDEAIAHIAQARGVLDKALRETTGPVVALADTSGSMGRDIEKVGTTNQYLSGISATRPVTAIYVDDQVRAVEQLRPGYPGVLVGGGITSFRPGFEYVATSGIRPGLLVYVTDGLCSDFPADPGYPVLWLLVRPAPGFKPPFGVVIGG
jgi:predicted metal-dependent peptidase